MDGEALTLGDVYTCCFLGVSFLMSDFFASANSRDNFLMEGGGDGRHSKEDVNTLFFGLFQSESELSSTNCRWHFSLDFGIFTIESRRT